MDSGPIGKDVIGKLELPGPDKLVLLACFLRRSRGVGREARQYNNCQGAHGVLSSFGYA
jgi:hypothetical protein